MCAVSLQTLAVTAVNRYFRVVRSRAQYQKIFNMKTTKITIAILWIMAFFAPLPYVIAGHEFFFHTGKVFCAHNAESLYDGYGAYLVLVYVAIPLIIIITCYTKVFIVVRKHNLNFRSRIRARTESCASSDGSLSVEEVNVTYTLLVVVIGFLTCWTPVLVIDLIDFINADWKLKRQVYVSYTCFGFASTSLNPIIYGIMNRSFRREYMRIVDPLKLWRMNSVSGTSKSFDVSGGKLSRKTLTKNKVVAVKFEMEESRESTEKKVVHQEAPGTDTGEPSTGQITEITEIQSS